MPSVVSSYTLLLFETKARGATATGIELPIVAGTMSVPVKVRVLALRIASRPPPTATALLTGTVASLVHAMPSSEENTVVPTWA